MSLIINHNTTALNAHRNLGISGTSMSKAIEKLSSGYKINVGADDPSGLIISEQLRSQISGLERAVRNSSEAFNLIGIAEGALNEMNSILKKMRALAIHAASNGVTSPEQVAADQAELDSGIDTLNRIANTTRYSDQYLLNGQKELVYNNHTIVDEPTDHELLDTKMTRVDQIFKRDGVKMSIGFTGSENKHKANVETSAQRAMLEADAGYPLSQIDGDTLTADQDFTLTGTKGSRMFNFTKGRHVGEMVSQINNAKDSTGIGATLIFASNVRVDTTTSGGTAPVYAPPPGSDADPMGGANPNFALAGNQYVYKKDDVQIYGASTNNPGESKIENFTMTPAASDCWRVGYNCDGDGKIYAKVVNESTGAIEYYKDKECTMLIGKGDAENFTAVNNSGLPGSPTMNKDGIFMSLTDKAKNLDVYEIAVVGQNLDNQKDMNVTGLQGFTDVGNSVMSGVNLGVNTSANGQVFIKYTPKTFDAAGNVETFTIEAYTDSSYEPKYLVGSSGLVNAGVNAGVTPNAQTVRIESVILKDGPFAGQESGLNITLNIPKPGETAVPDIDMVGQISFTNLGVRLYADEYGSADSIRIQNNKGSLFYSYREADSMERIMVEPDKTVQVAGQDAQFTLNGAPIYTTGLVANTTTPDFSGSLVFNKGKLGVNTIAVNGYDEGKLYSKATDLQGVEENEQTIERQNRHMEPQAKTYSATGMVDKTGQPINLYLDFSQIDSTVESKIAQPLPKNLSISVEYIPGVGGNPGQLQIRKDMFDGASPGVVTLDVTEEAIREGLYMTDPTLMGLFVKIDGLPDDTRSAQVTTTDATVEARGGNCLVEVNTYATHPRGSTQEDMTDFIGGMQFQLGNTEGDQDRMIYSVPSMSMSQLGRIEYNGEEFCLQHVLGGGRASLSKDPVLAMRVLKQAVDDVSGLRARLGAFQSNMLQTNINSLEVAIENITKTESAIRDTDMAAESTQFTRFQIMQQAGTSMLAQANQVSQNVLSLLQ